PTKPSSPTSASRRQAGVRPSKARPVPTVCANWSLQPFRPDHTKNHSPSPCGRGSRGGVAGPADTKPSAVYAAPMPSRTLPALPHPPAAAVTSEQRVWAGRFALAVGRSRHRRFDGTQSGAKTWELWRRGRAAAVLPYDPMADAVVLIEQFRLPALAAGLDP